MAGNSEIIAILSNGISFKRLMKPYMISALVIAIFTFIFGSYLIPPRQRDADQGSSRTTWTRGKRKRRDRDVQFKVGPGTIVYF